MCNSLSVRDRRLTSIKPIPALHWKTSVAAVLQYWLNVLFLLDMRHTTLGEPPEDDEMRVPDTTYQRQDSNLKTWPYEAKYATSRPRMLHTNLFFIIYSFSSILHSFEVVDYGNNCSSKMNIYDKVQIYTPRIPSAFKWNEWGFKPLLRTHRLNWARRTSRGWCDKRDDTALQTQDSKFEPCRSEAEHATSRSRRLPTILNIYEWAGENILFLWNMEARVGFESAISDFPSRQLQPLHQGPRSLSYQIVRQRQTRPASAHVSDFDRAICMFLIVSSAI